MVSKKGNQKDNPKKPVPPPKQQNIESIVKIIIDEIIDESIKKIIINEIVESFGPFYCGITVSYTDTDQKKIEYDISHQDLMAVVSKLDQNDKDPDKYNYEDMRNEELNRIVEILNETVKITEYADAPQLAHITPNDTKHHSGNDTKHMQEWLDTSAYLRKYRKRDNTTQTSIGPPNWWVLINGRLLSIKNYEKAACKKKGDKIVYKNQYYISDHGEMLDIQWQQAGTLFSNRYLDAKSTRTTLKSLQKNKTIICNTVHTLMNSINAILSASTENTDSSDNSTWLKQLQTFLGSLQLHENMIFETAKNLYPHHLARTLLQSDNLEEPENKDNIILGVYWLMQNITSFTEIKDITTKKYYNSLMSHIDHICDTTHDFMVQHTYAILKTLRNDRATIMVLLDSLLEINNFVDTFIKSNYLQTSNQFIQYYEKVLKTSISPDTDESNISNTHRKPPNYSITYAEHVTETETDSNQDTANVIIRNWAERKINRLNNSFANQIKEVIDTYTFALLPISRPIIEKTERNKKMKELARLVKIMHEGTNTIETFLYRPLNAYHTLKGAPYHEFRDAVIEYINSENTPDINSENTRKSKSKNLVTMMRAILKNEQDGNIPPFLPNLVGSWFLSETARYRESYISSLLMMDMIENPWDYTEDSTPSEHCYKWENTLVHPKNDTIRKQNSEIKEDSPNIKHIETAIDYAYSLGGRHPMASSKTSHTTGDNAFKDNLIKPKERSLLVHWVYKCLKHLTKGEAIKITLNSVQNDEWKIRADEETRYDYWKQYNTANEEKTSTVESNFSTNIENDQCNIHSGQLMSEEKREQTSDKQIKEEGNKWKFIEKTIQPLLDWRCKHVDSFAAFPNATFFNRLPSIENSPITSTSPIPNGQHNPTNEAESKNDDTQQLVFDEYKPT